MSGARRVSSGEWEWHARGGPGGRDPEGPTEEHEMATATGLPTQMYIDGQWRDADSGEDAGRDQPGRRVDDRRGGLRRPCRGRPRRSRRRRGRIPAWRATSVYDRAKILKKTADLMRDRADTIARALTQEQGKPLPEAKGEVLHAADTFEWFAEEGKRAYGRIIPPCERRQAALRDQAPGGRRRHDHPLELPGGAAQPQDRPGPGRRLHGRQPAGRADAADPDPDVRVPGRRGPPARRGQPGDGPRPRRSPTPSSSTRRSARSASPARPRWARS